MDGAQINSNQTEANLLNNEASSPREATQQTIKFTFDGNSTEQQVMNYGNSTQGYEETDREFLEPKIGSSIEIGGQNALNTMPGKTNKNELRIKSSLNTFLFDVVIIFFNVRGVGELNNNFL